MVNNSPEPNPDPTGVLPLRSSILKVSESFPKLKFAPIKLYNTKYSDFKSARHPRDIPGHGSMPNHRFNGKSGIDSIGQII